MSLADKPIHPSGKEQYTDLQTLAAQQGPLSLEATMRAIKPTATGMTLLEHYAGLAMQSMVMQAEVLERHDLLAGTKLDSFEAGVAEGAVALAQSLIAELEKAKS